MSIHKEVKILVVDDDKYILKILEKFLEKKNLPVVITDSPVEAAKLLKNEHFDILITDINMPEINGFELILWIKNNKITTNIIVLTANYSESAEKTYARFGVLKFMAKPINFENLLWTINIIINEGFFSKVTEISLFDYVQMINFAQKDKIVTVTPGNSIIPSYIYFKKGEIIHASHENLTGEEAFFKIMAIKGGSFNESEFKEPAEVTVNLPVSALIFRAGEIIDEDNIKKSSGLSPEIIKMKNTDEVYKVLITDDDENIRNLIGEFLQKQGGIDVVLSESALQSSQLVLEKHFDLAIIDINMPEVNGFEFLFWLKKNNVDVKVILMSEDDSQEAKEFALQQGSVKFFHKGSTIQELYEFIQQDKLNSFTGTVSKISIFDYAQMITLSRKNKLIEVRSPLTNSEGQIYFKNGNIIHAVLEELKGQEAFFKIVSIIGGIITELPWKEPSEISIQGNPGSLLFKATRYLDEEIINMNEIKIDENIIKIIENKINNSEPYEKAKIFTTTGSYKRPLPPEERNFPQNLNLSSFLKAKNSMSLNPNMFQNTSRPKQNVDEEVLKPFEGMKSVMPVLTKSGEYALIEPKTPISTYQLLKKFDGKNSLDHIYRNYYYHISLNEFMTKLEGMYNYTGYTKKEDLPPDKELKGKIIQVLLYMKLLDPRALVKKVQDESFTGPEDASFSGEILIKYGLISEEDLKEGLLFQKKFNSLVDRM